MVELPLEEREHRGELLSKEQETLVKCRKERHRRGREVVKQKVQKIGALDRF